MQELLQNHPVFGSWLIEDDEDVYRQHEQSFQGNTVRMALNIENDSKSKVTAKGLDELAQFVTQLTSYDEKIRSTLAQQFDQEGSSVADYIEHHQSEGVFPELSATEFLNKFHLISLSMYYDTWDEDGAGFDYSVDPEQTQYVLSVKVNRSGEVLGVEMES